MDNNLALILIIGGVAVVVISIVLAILFEKKSKASATTIAPKNGFYVAYIPVNNDIMKRTQLRTAGGQVIYTYTINQ